MNCAKARADLFEKQAMPLRRYLFGQAYFHTRNANDAEDLVQETLSRGLEKFHQYKQGTNLKAWLSRIMSNQFISDCRKRKARIQASSFDGMENTLSADMNPDVQREIEVMQPADIARDERFLQSIDERLKLGLDTMSLRYRDAFLLSTLCDMSSPEVARRLKIPVGTVMSRLHRAKQAMRAAYLQTG